MRRPVRLAEATTPAMRGPLWTEGVPPSKRAEGTHAAEPAKATATRVPDNASEAPASKDATNKPAPAMRGPLWTEGPKSLRRRSGGCAAGAAGTPRMRCKVVERWGLGPDAER